MKILKQTTHSLMNQVTDRPRISRYERAKQKKAQNAGLKSETSLDEVLSTTPFKEQQTAPSPISGNGDVTKEDTSKVGNLSGLRCAAAQGGSTGKFKDIFDNLRRQAMNLYLAESKAQDYITNTPVEHVKSEDNDPIITCSSGVCILDETLEVQGSAMRLAMFADAMIKYVEKESSKTGLKFNEKFRIELMPEDHHNLEGPWQMKLYLDPIVWFDSLIKTSTNKANELNKAREYVNRCRSMEGAAGKYDDGHTRVPAITPPPYCNFPAACKQNLDHKGNTKLNHPKHAKLYCSVKVNRQDGDKPCQQYFPDELIIGYWPICEPETKVDKWSKNQEQLIQTLSRPATPRLETVLSGETLDGVGFSRSSRFVLVARNLIIRDFLVAPYPSEWHMTNKQMVTRTPFWEAAILICRVMTVLSENSDICPVRCIAINFGKWESAEAKDQYAKDCHAHAHFLLSPSFVASCNETRFPQLTGRMDDPPNYYQENGKSREFDRLLSAENAALKDDIRDIKDNIRNLTNLVQIAIQQRRNGVELSY